MDLDLGALGSGLAVATVLVQFGVVTLTFTLPIVWNVETGPWLHRPLPWLTGATFAAHCIAAGLFMAADPGLLPAAYGIGVAVLGVASTVLLARSLRRAAGDGRHTRGGRGRVWFGL